MSHLSVVRRGVAFAVFGGEPVARRLPHSVQHLRVCRRRTDARSAYPPRDGGQGAPGAFHRARRRSDVVWARGFGIANPKDSTPATARTVYRVGSVSKLFTDIGVMQLVERGVLDLDAPVTRYVPDFHPSGQGASAITLRQLMSHRSGLVREPPVGHYFDSSSASLGRPFKRATHASRMRQVRGRSTPTPA
jgi:CubicO group peptidase (beta-lactamase class C family)